MSISEMPNSYMYCIKTYFYCPLCIYNFSGKSGIKITVQTLGLPVSICTYIHEYIYIRIHV